MPNEPERDIEKRLRSYTRQRREESGAPPEMDAATRRRLHEEIARTCPQTERGASLRFGWEWFSWPRLAVGFSVFVLAGVMAFYFMSPGPKKQKVEELSMNRVDMYRPAVPASTAAPAVVAAPPPSSSGTIFKSEISQNKPIAANSTGTRERDLDGRKLADLSDGAAVQPIGATHRSAIPSSSVGFGEQISGQNYSRIETNNGLFAGSLAKERKAQIVLSQFRVEQNGTQLRFVDRDGSVYVGDIENNASRSRRKLSLDRASNAPPQKEALQFFAVTNSLASNTPMDTAEVAVKDISVQTNRFFMVTGTNLTLKQTVMFTGEFVSNAMQSNLAYFGGLNGNATSANIITSNKSGSLIMSNELLTCPINGSAKIGTNPAFNVYAAPTQAK